jgi:hypothetical protein
MSPSGPEQSQYPLGPPLGLPPPLGRRGGHGGIGELAEGRSRPPEADRS